MHLAIFFGMKNFLSYLSRHQFFSFICLCGTVEVSVKNIDPGPSDVEV